MISRIIIFVLCMSACVARADCFSDAAKTHNVREDLLRAIAKVESNYNPEALNAQSHALGMMQIHPVNFKSLAKYNITEQDLHNPCTNINVGAWILADFIRQYGRVWRAVGAYGVNNKGKHAEHQRVIYVEKVQRAMVKLNGKTPKKVFITPVAHKNPPKPQMLVME
jgi:soluble lytic murein transglycosylase-like protein